MAITVEPGIYIPKKFGVRIEDSLMLKDRAYVMHKFTKDLIIIRKFNIQILGNNIILLAKN